MAAVQKAFSEQPTLLKRINAVSARNNELTTLFVDVANYVNALRSSSNNGIVEPAAKKRKIDSPSTNNARKWQPTATFQEISFTIPQRKKLRLEIDTTPSAGVRVVQASGDIEATAPWTSIHSIACVPIPEKAQAQHNFCIFYKSPSEEEQQIVFSVPAMAPKPGSVSFSSGTPDPTTTYKPLLLQLLNERIRVSEPTTDEFSSSLPQALRKGETAFHIKAFKGAKEGYLFLLSDGILYGFKKPLEYYPFSVIDSVSYTSILQRTFNLNITVRKEGEEEADAREEEFGMLDQADFAGIDEYVRKHKLQDSSMAEQRRAKKLNVNGVKGEGGEGEEDGEGELVKAAREAEEEDEEEEDDENFDPGSEGESEGEGSGSDSDDDENMGDGDGGSDDDDDEEDE